jgi:CPA1 family monovalent cation:H+ antiporter
MGIIEIIALLTTIAALFSYINYKFIKLPTTIALMIFSLVLSLGILGLSDLLPSVNETAHAVVESIDFNITLMHGLLAFLLFAGALHVRFESLAERGLEVAVYAIIGTLVSTVLVGLLLYSVVMLLGLPLEFMHCILFGSLISPTDPIAVLGIFKKVGAPKSLEIQLTGESLFNDGIGVVVFLTLAGIIYPADAHGSMDAMGIVKFFLVEALGGILLGFAAGWLAYQLLRSVDNYKVEVLITLALVIGGYTLAGALHMSGPLMVVVAGLLLGNSGRRYAMSPKTVEHLDDFWELIDEILNAVLFVLLGLEIIIVSFQPEYWIAGAIAIVICLLSRFVAIGVPVSIMRRWKNFNPRVITLLTWGGLRGGIPVALALSLPDSPEREILLTITYAVVIFSIIVQGLTIKPLLLTSMKKESGLLQEDH